MICHCRFHRTGDAQRLVHATEPVAHEVPRDWPHFILGFP